MHLPSHLTASLGRLATPLAPSRLEQLTGFGSNPGNLTGWFRTPPGGADLCPLVVVLHGCTQTAAGYDQGSGWSQLAEEYGFAVLFPEQQRANNPNLCFNWFEPAHTRRGRGEALSIAQMIDSLVERYGVDGERVFITGLSAGGAMTSVMLAAYPEKFAGGAILAGLPHGAAASVHEAVQQMRSHTPNRRTSGRSIAEASPHSGRWPTISIWHGTADAVVHPSNSDAILRQWQDVHGVEGPPAETNSVDGHWHRVWRDAAGRAVIEDYRVSGMGHGAALSTEGECGCGEAGAFMLEAGISSTVRSAQAWGLLGRRISAPGKAPPEPAYSAASAPHAAGRVAQTIEQALRSAGLLK